MNNPNQSLCKRILNRLPLSFLLWCLPFFSFGQSGCDLDPQIEYVVFSGANCAMQFTLAEEYQAIDDPLCQQWTVTGTDNYVDSGNSLLILDGNQPFSICYTACCEIDGEVEFFETCLNFPSGCETVCQVDPQLDYIIFSGPNCSMEIFVTEDIPFVDDATCQQWTVTGTDDYITEGDHIWILNSTEPFSVCYTACCEVDGQIETVEICQDFPFGCDDSCDPDPHIKHDSTSNFSCQYGFWSGGPIEPINGGNCNTWDIIDSDGEVIFEDVGNGTWYEFPEPGQYEVCYTYCCEVDGEIIEFTICDEIDIDTCVCEPQPEFNYLMVEGDSCRYGFLANGSQDASEEGCQVWTVTAPGIEDTFTGSFLDYTFPYDGTYTVCHTACCTVGDETTSEEYCEEIEVVGCGPVCDAHIKYGQDETYNCTYTFWSGGTGLGIGDESCHAWEITDSDGEVLLEWGNGGFGFTFPENGTYTVCLTYCCEINGEVVPIETCVEIVTEGCLCEPNTDFTYFIHEDNPCVYDFAATRSAQSVGLCMDWELRTTDGTPIATGEGVWFQHEFEESGDYIICYEACCEFGGEIYSAQNCQTITVVGCNEDACEPDGSFEVTPIQGGPCCFNFQSTGGNPWLDNNGCQVWRISQNGVVIHAEQNESMDYCFTQQGQYTVCYRACCEVGGNIVTDTQCQNVNCGSKPDNEDPRRGRKTMDITVSENVVVFPNPTRGIINIQFSEDAGSTSIDLIGVTGKILKHWMFSETGDLLELEAADLPPGNYHLQVKARGFSEVVQIVLVD